MICSRLIAAFRQKTDYQRWSDPSSLEAWWAPRARELAAFVPSGSRVIEFGAGNRILERYLEPSCTYVASDIVDRGPGTIICDLNRRPLPGLKAGTFDIAVFIGVLEYLRDVPSVFDWLAPRVSYFLLSYVCADPDRGPLSGLREAFRRMKMGWMNNYREQDIRELLSERGFNLIRESAWKNNRLFLFSRSIRSP